MWVELAQNFAYDSGALAVLRRRLQFQLAHGEEDAPVHGLEAVARVRERPPQNRGKGVFHEAVGHLIF